MNTIVAISGSLRRGASNHAILQFLSSQVPAGVNYIIYNGLADVPPFNPELDTDTPPASVQSLRLLLSKADGIIICTPEYAFGVPGALKNMLDWLVSSSTLVDKPVALITASLGGQHAHASLLLTLGALSAKVADSATLLISFLRAKVNTEGKITDAQTSDSLRSLLTAFISQ